ncbi:conserved hypothetical protein [Ricinus communis]|uniref:Leucine-rich repeat-containing N-terminal plant-type domain-containing protein n=1 Tax=Ricinus communis TaxID=3988 RepID=B9S9R5_RICCO|nr:conserved hypothetical protein [Ricinus communis]
MLPKAAAAAAPSNASSKNLELEARALNQSGWWWCNQDTSEDHCQWYGINCNSAGSITKIDFHFYYYGYNCNNDIRYIEKLSFSSLPNLISFNLSRCAFHGSITFELGKLSRLKYLDLS